MQKDFMFYPDATAKLLEGYIGESSSYPKDFFKINCKVCGASLPVRSAPPAPTAAGTDALDGIGTYSHFIP